jgi:hypothetical protein
VDVIDEELDDFDEEPAKDSRATAHKFESEHTAGKKHIQASGEKKKSSVQSSNGMPLVILSSLLNDRWMLSRCKSSNRHVML